MDVQEGGLKRSFANLDANDTTAAQNAARRPHIKCDNLVGPPLEPDGFLKSSTVPAKETGPTETLTSADLPIAGQSCMSILLQQALQLRDWPQ